MELKVDPLKCIECGLCELACGYHWDDALSGIASSIIVYRTREKKNYFGIVLKTGENLVLGRPEGLEVQKIGVTVEGAVADPSAKPILLREPCDLCQGFAQPLCVQFCPTGVLSVGD
jgi:ferredoxin